MKFRETKKKEAKNVNKVQIAHSNEFETWRLIKKVGRAANRRFGRIRAKTTLTENLTRFSLDKIQIFEHSGESFTNMKLTQGRIKSISK